MCKSTNGVIERSYAKASNIKAHRSEQMKTKSSSYRSYDVTLRSSIGFTIDGSQKLKHWSFAKA
jgi:hypothetical protein